MPTFSYGQSGSPSSGSYTGPWNQGTQSIYSVVGWPTGNVDINGTTVVNIDSISLSGTFSSSGGYSFYHTSNGRVGVSWNSAFRLNYTRYIDNGLDLIDTSSGSDKTNGGLRGTTTWSTVPEKPGTPTAVASSSVERRVSLSWTAPDNGGATITGYNIYDASDNSLIATTSGTGTTANVTVAAGKLGTSMSFNVAAINARGISQRSNNSNSVLINGNPTAPTLNSVATGTVNKGSVTLVWTAPTEDVTGITGYDIYAAPVGDTRIKVHSTTGTGTSVTLTDAISDPDLDDGVEHRFDVRARNAFSDANNSRSVASNTIDQFVSGPPGAPTITGVFNTDTDLSVSVLSLKVAWTAPENIGRPQGIVEYIVYWYKEIDGFGSAQQASAGTSTEFTTPANLDPDADYIINVVARNGLSGADSFGPLSEDSTPIAPSAPGGWEDSTISQDFRVGVYYEDGVAREPGGTAYYSVSSGSLPTGITLNESTGEISGVPSQQEKATFQIASTLGAPYGEPGASNEIFLDFTVYVKPVALKKGEVIFEPSTMFKRFTNAGWVDVGTEDVLGSPVGMKRYDGVSWTSTERPDL